MIDLTLAILLAGFAVYRVARMVAKEEGPGSVFLHLRNRFLGDSWIDRGLHCPLCVGFWVALLPAIAIAWVLGLGSWVLGFWLSIAGVQAFLQGFDR